MSINSLVEQDGIKILIVANEDEIIKYQIPTSIPKQYRKSTSKNILECNKEDNDDKENYTDNTLKYMIIKEKTVSDTMKFMPSLTDSIKSIIDKFDNEILTYVINNLDNDFLKQLFE